MREKKLVLYYTLCQRGSTHSRLLYFAAVIAASPRKSDLGKRKKSIFQGAAGVFCCNENEDSTYFKLQPFMAKSINIRCF